MRWMSRQPDKCQVDPDGVGVVELSTFKAAMLQAARIIEEFKPKKVGVGFAGPGPLLALTSDPCDNT